MVLDNFLMKLTTLGLTLHIKGESSKITRPKNKNMQNSVSFFLYIHVLHEKSTAFEKFEKKPLKSPKNFFSAAGLSNY